MRIFNIIQKALKKVIGLKQYSTASKVIHCVEQELFSALRKIRRLPHAYNIYNGDEHFASLYKKNDLINVLGQLLENNLTTQQYAIYQSLNYDLKIKLRQILIKTYYHAILSSVTLQEVRISLPSVYRYYPDRLEYEVEHDIYNYTVKIPDDFLCENKLGVLLADAFAKVTVILDAPSELLGLDTIELGPIKHSL